MKFLRLARLASIPATIGTMLVLAHAVPASATVGDNSGFYDLCRTPGCVNSNACSLRQQGVNLRRSGDGRPRRSGFDRA